MDAASLAMALLGAASIAAVVTLTVAVAQASARPRVLCLMYHRVAPREHWASLRGLERIFTLPEDAFDAQLAWLEAEGFRFAAAGDVARFARGEGDLPDRSVLLTIDDGCESAHRGLLPILQRHGARAILFVTTDPEAAIFRGGERRVTDDELRALADGGVEIGSHAVSHRPLSAMTEPEIREELVGSKAELERVTGRPVRHFAVPANWYDDRVLRIARESGYESVFCSRPDTVRRASGAFGIPRLNVEGGLDLAGFERSLRPAAIALRRIVLFARGLPKRALGPTVWTAVRGAIFGRVRADWLSPRRMALALAAIVGLALVLSAGWLIAR